MTDSTNSGGRRSDSPQSVVGPISLGRKRPGGGPTPVQPNSVIGPISLGIEAGCDVSVTAFDCSGGGATLTVTCNGQTQTISIAGLTGSADSSTLPAGSTLYAIARVDGDVVLLATSGGQNVFVTIPSAADGVTIDVTGPAVK